jgi:hypothetical protein
MIEYKVPSISATEDGSYIEVSNLKSIVIIADDGTKITVAEFVERLFKAEQSILDLRKLIGTEIEAVTESQKLDLDAVTRRLRKLEQNQFK